MNTTRNTRARRSGFTLIEVLLVILILGTLAAVLVVSIGGQQEGAKIDTTKLMVDKLANKLENYNLDIGHYPTESEGGIKALTVQPSFQDEKAGEKWRGPYAQERELVDAWQNPFNYEASDAGSEVAPGIRFKLWSNGPDRQSNTADDIRNWEEQR